VIVTAFVRPAFLARFALALAALAGLTSCGSGAVSPQVVDPTRITILPATATLFSGMPTTFTISGGTGAYIVSSSNQAVVQVSGTSNGTLIIAPNPVLADTTVTLTVRDTGTNAPVTATLTVKPNTVNNSITITPTATQGASCAPAVCSGGDAEVTATISQGGIPLAARGVRLEVISGSFRFIVNPPGTPEVLATVTDVVTDEVGKVRARIRVLADAPNQTALLQVTDLGTLAFQRASFVIAQSTGTSPGFTVAPSTITFTGATTAQCMPAGQTALIYIFGGVPPYSILNTGDSIFTTNQDVVLQSGGSFSIRTTGDCGSFPILVRDSAGHTASVTVENKAGTAAPSPVVVSPDAVTIFFAGTGPVPQCSGASSTVGGGLGPGSYFVASGSSAYLVSISAVNPTVSIRRSPGSVNPNPGGVPPSTTLIGVSDGQTTDFITVTDSCP
jgi:hypothetical protein